MVNQLDQLAEKLKQKALSRRNFLASAGVVTAATMAGCSNSTTFTPTQPVTPAPATPLTDVDILNFALNLEYLEAEYYLRAAAGVGLAATDQGTPGTVTIKSGPVKFSNSFYQQIAFELAQTELQHVRAIRATITALGGMPIDAPARNYTDAFNTIASSAGISGGFDPFASDFNFFVGALAFEEVGVSAYTGAAALIKATAVLDAAAGIQAAEAYHAGTLRTILAGQALATNTQTYLNAYNSILKVEGTLGGAANVTPLMAGGVANGVVTPSTVVSADPINAIAFARTPDQVMHIVYGTMPGVLTASGGFFPNGLNGTIKTPTS